MYYEFGIKRKIVSNKFVMDERVIPIPGLPNSGDSLLNCRKGKKG